jgi:hypothetical protein
MRLPPPGGTPRESAEEIMNMLEAFDLTGSLCDAGELAGVSHHTVARYVAARDARALSDRAAARPQLIDEFLPKIEEWVERSAGKVRADVAHDKLVGLGFTGSERTTKHDEGRDRSRPPRRVRRGSMPDALRRHPGLAAARRLVVTRERG